MVGDLGAHQLSLLDHFARERIVPLTRLVGDDAERSLKGMCEIADMGARPIDDLPVGLDQGIELLLQRLDLSGELALQTLGLAGADRRKVVPDRDREPLASTQRSEPLAKLQKPPASQPPQSCRRGYARSARARNNPCERRTLKRETPWPTI
jgi:hypothetical protein